MNGKKEYRGIIVPSVTPLTAQHKLDEVGVEKIFSNFYKYNISPFILGTTGESASLPIEIKKAFVKNAYRIKAKNSVLYAGISSNCFRESVDFAAFCFDHGVDAVAATLPSYYILSESEMEKYFIDLADAIPVPLIIYNIPATTHMSIPLSLIDELSHHPNIIAIKDSERNEERLRESLVMWKDRDDFMHFSGWAAKSVQALAGGSAGLVPSTGNLVPEIYAVMLSAVKEQDHGRAEEMQQLSDAYGNLYQKGRSLGESLWALKVLMHELTLCLPYVAPPLRSQSADEEKNLSREFKDFTRKHKLKLI